MKTIQLLKKTTIALALLSVGVSNTTALAADGGVYESNGSVEFVPSTEVTGPIDPENPEAPGPIVPIDPTNPDGPNPGTPGPLSIDFASSFDFGKNSITNLDKVYYAAAQGFSEGIEGEFRGNYVQITDNRGTNAGWTLRLKQEGQFSSDTATKFKELTGSQISIADSVAVSNSIGVPSPKVENITLDPDGASSIIMSAEEGSGVGTWVDYFGASEEMEIEGELVQKNKAVTLAIPGSTPKEAVIYTTKLTWTLTDVPGLEG